MLSLVKDESYRDSEKKINRIRWQEKDITQSRTIANIVEVEGSKIDQEIEKRSDKILEAYGFDRDGQPKGWDGSSRIEIETELISEEIVQRTIEEYNKGKEEELQISASELNETYENPWTCVNISIDEVGVKKQKENGRKPNCPRKEGKEYVRNSIIQVQKVGSGYILNGLGIVETIRRLIAFLLHNDLLRKGSLLFFVDGAKDLHSAIKSMFGWIPYRIILDWYHLVKKCEMQLSLGLKNKGIRNEILRKVRGYLWVGKIDHAVKVLGAVEEKDIKSQVAIDCLISYFERNRSYIPCYGLRKRLGLRISSNRGEKANDLAVADRQKHNGMSWSKKGSSALASVITLHQNNEQDNWIKKRQILFELKKAA
ncbi:MAG: hypothetical protein AB1422_15340 [bacterium]